MGSWPRPAVAGSRRASPGRRCDSARQLGRDALDHAGQHPARAAFDDELDAARLERLHASRPSAPGRPPAAPARRGCARGSVSTATSMLLTTGICGAANSSRRQPLAQRFGRRLHQARMERRRHRQRQRALGAAGLEHLAGLVDRGLAAGDHGLRRVVEIDGLHHFGAVRRRKLRRRLGATARSPSQRPCRGWPPWRQCPPAPPAAWPAARKRTSGAACASVSTPAATSAEYSPSEWPATTAGVGAAFGQPGAPGGHAGHQHHGLGVGGQGQRLLGPFADQRGRRLRPAHRTLRAAVSATAGWSPQASSMPTACEPWPGKDESEGFIVLVSPIAARRPRMDARRATNSVARRPR